MFLERTSLAILLLGSTVLSFQGTVSFHRNKVTDPYRTSSLQTYQKDETERSYNHYRDDHHGGDQQHAEYERQLQQFYSTPTELSTPKQHPDLRESETTHVQRDVSNQNEAWTRFRALSRTGSPEPLPSDERIWPKRNDDYDVQELIESFVSTQINWSEDTESLNWESIWKNYKKRQDAFLADKASDLKQRSDLAFRSAYERRKMYQATIRCPEDTLVTSGMTERIMRRIPLEEQATGAGGASTWEAFQKAEENWATMKKLFPNKFFEYTPQEFVVENDLNKGNPECWAKLDRQRDQELDYDAIVCGGTLGIFFATALLLKGHRVAVLEAGALRGREQEWNISLDELMELVELGVLSQDDVDAAVTTEFSGCRSGFKNREVTPLEGGYFENGIGFECFTENVLNLGISPSILLDRVANRFQSLGGEIFEGFPVRGVAVLSDVGSAVDLGNEYEPLTARICIDCMGNASPITRQARYGLKPDGVCVVVGSCAAGYDPQTNIIGDIIYTNTEIQDNGKNGKNQYFWEAFPVGVKEGTSTVASRVKTTYMFTYMDANQKRPSLETLMEDYWRLLPKYQPSIKNPETDLDFRRVLYAYFPTYRDSPLKTEWDRVIAVGDASGIQSPLSFGGFGALTRHLGRVSGAISEALDKDLLGKTYLGEINAYTPNLSAAWMFQKAMSVRMGSDIHPKFINRLLATNFEVMESMGPDTIKPFLQDVIRFDALVGSLARSFLADPTFMPQIVSHVGIPTLVDWLRHVGMMGTYSFLDKYFANWGGPIFESTLRDEGRKFLWRRKLDSWKYGSGQDYILPSQRDSE